MTAPRANHIGVVIVGSGAGKRFGGPKAIALLPDGRRFLDAIVETAAKAGLDSIVAVLPPNVAASPNVRVVINSKPEAEQIASVRLGLAQLQNTPVAGALIWPVDHPFVELDSVVAIVDAVQRTNPAIAVPKFGDRRGHPVYFRRDIWVELMTVADGGARSVVRTEFSRVCEVGVLDVGILRDIDVKADMSGE